MNRLFVAVFLAALSCAAIDPALALTTKECSAKYQAAKQAGTLNGQKWNDFRKVECGAAPDVPTTTVQNPVAPGAKTAAPSPNSATAAAKPAPAPSATPPAAGSAVFPKAIDPKYGSLSAGKARQKTCLDQYNVNKAAGGPGNGGLNWIQKGGGYYLECNKRLKG
ncbi:hypothetical protein [Methylobacterium nigriterrae]|uniref:hypothetical protein n=1 Tax=Methylobacterium nigriterrae TaxID=3127512 RepID=UPI003014041B